MKENLRRNKLQAALALGIIGGGVTAANPPEMYAPPNPHSNVETVINKRAGLSCEVDLEIQPIDKLLCEFTTGGNPYLLMHATNVSSRGEESVMFFLAGTAVSFKIFNRKVNMDIHTYNFENHYPDGGSKYAQFPVHDARVGLGAGELFQTDAIPESITVRNSDGTAIGSRRPREAVDIFLADLPPLIVE